MNTFICDECDCHRDERDRVRLNGDAMCVDCRTTIERGCDATAKLAVLIGENNGGLQRSEAGKNRSANTEPDRREDYRKVVSEMRKEQQLLRELRRRLGGLWQGIETTTASGVPDAYYHTSWTSAAYGVTHGSGWIELKTYLVENAGDWSVLSKKIRRTQVVWLTRHARAGGRGFLCVLIPRRRVVLIPAGNLVDMKPSNPFPWTGTVFDLNSANDIRRLSRTLVA